MPGHYIDDPPADYSLWLPSTGIWLFRDPVCGGTWTVSQGASDDVPLSYMGPCGYVSLATFRPSTGDWTIKWTNGWIIEAAPTDSVGGTPSRSSFTRTP